MYVPLIFRSTMLKTLQWPSRLVSVVTCYPHVKYFSIKTDLMEASNAGPCVSTLDRRTVPVSRWYYWDFGTTLERLWSDFASPLSVSITSRLILGGSKTLEAVNGSCDVRTRGHWKSGF